MDVILCSGRLAGIMSFPSRFEESTISGELNFFFPGSLRNFFS